MRKTIIQILTQNLGLKLLALVFSIVLWFAVVNVNDPQQTRTYTVKVTVDNADALSEQGKFYEITGGRDTVSFRVSAKRSVHEDLSNSDFRATADLNDLEEESRIPVEITATRHASQLNIANRSYYLYVTVGTTQTTKYVITPEVSGDPAEGYAVGSVSATPNVITISGPEEIVSTISRVTASCDVSGMAGDIVESVVPRLYDESGYEISQNGLSLSLSTVDVAVDMLTLRTVPIEVNYSGEPAQGSYIAEVTAEPESVEVMGEPDVVNEMTVLSIPASAVNVAGLSEDTDLTVDISSYLPEGISARDANTRVTIHVVMEVPAAQTITIPTSALIFTGLPDGVAVLPEETELTLTVTGYAAELEALDPQTLQLSIDASDVTEDTQAITIPEDVLGARFTVEETQVAVSVLFPEEEEAAEEETTADDTAAETTTSNNAAGH